MGATFTASAVFKAVDKVSAVMSKMSRATQSFSKRTQIAFSRIEMQSRRLTQRFSKMLGVVGKLGLGFSALMIAQQIATANIELDASLASLSAITGKTGAQFQSYVKQVEEVSKAQKAFAGDTAKAFEVVASAQPILLENAVALGKVTDAAITLAKASGDELAQSALSLTGVMNQFNLGAEEATRVMNTLAAGSVAGSSNITNVAASMKNFGAVANAANISVEESVALVEVMGSKSIFAEEAGTKLRGAILKLQKAGMGYESGLFNINDALAESKKKLDSFATAQEKDTFLLKTFGAMNITTGQILLSNIDKFESLTKAVTGTNTAFEQADIKSNTIANRLKELQAAFQNAVTSTDSENTALVSLKKILVLVADNMDKIIGIVIILIKVFILYKAVVIGAMLAQKALLVVMAVAKFVKFIRIVMLIAKAKGIWAAAQWVLNVALNANPIGLIMLAIAALVGVVTLIIKKWETWGSALTLVMGPLGFVISLIQSFRKNWDLVKASFSQGGILKGLLTIGKVILDAILMPVQQLLELLGKIPGLDIANTGAAKIENFRNNLFAAEKALIPEEERLQTTASTVAQENIKREERIEKQQSTLTIKNNSGLDAELDNPMGAPILLTATN